ncbi:MAG: hypothetical protein DWI03_09740 [Planctomycetota bacterium]|jgi:hypothetical protein|nr:MAG: hypothetical protein DWI03_09740 [Planctomycetota bacterium]
MAISVVCPGCKARFSVSDQFAGRTGPCPKCKKPITIPAVAVKAVTIHEPEAPAASSAGTGRAPTAPIRRIETRIPIMTFVLVGVGALACLLLAYVFGKMFGPLADAPLSIAALLWFCGFVIAVPCVMLGYVAVRDRELEPYRSTPLLLRTLACATVYAVLWAAKGMLPAEATAEMWQWLYLAPLFLGAGAVAALASLDLDPTSALAHYSLYAMFTSLLRWLAGLPPL